jgi:hypothetical protein
LTNPYLLRGAHRIFDLHEGSFFIFVERDPRDVAAEIFRKDYRSKCSFTCRADWALSHAVRYLEATRRLAESSRLYSPAMARFTPLTMVETGEPSFSNCSAQ